MGIEEPFAVVAHHLEREVSGRVRPAVLRHRVGRIPPPGEVEGFDALEPVRGYVPWPRVYVDLPAEGVRGEEAAEHLREVMHGG